MKSTKNNTYDFLELKEELAVLENQKYPNLEYFLDVIQEKTEPVRSLFIDYECAALEVETKFRVLSDRLSIKYDRNPIESIRTRIKQPDSILRKLQRKGYPFTLQAMQDHVYDVAGVRVICSFVNDIYRLGEVFLSQDDITLIERKDYIQNPKESGYRSLHLIVQTPIFTETGKKMMYVEVQLRTMAMDFWASLEHKLTYKKNLNPVAMEKLAEELKTCATESAKLDFHMQSIRDRIVETDALEKEASERNASEKAIE